MDIQLPFDPLAHAIYNDQYDATILILKHTTRLCPIHRTDYYGWRHTTHLLLYISRGGSDSHIIDSLMQLGSDIEEYGYLFDTSPCDRTTPLDLAIGKGNIEAVRTMISYPRKEAIERYIYAAITAKQSDIAILLMDMCCVTNINNRVYGNDTLLYAAVITKQTDITMKLLTYPDIDVNMIYGRNYTILHHMIGIGDETLVRTLLRDHIVDTRVINSNKRSSLHMAIIKGNSNMLKLILEYDPIGARLLINKTCHNKKCMTSCVHLAASKSSTILLDTLLPYGPNLNLASYNNGPTPLQIATNNNRSKVVQWLKDHGAVR
jgi:ankyrin repeat protein